MQSNFILTRTRSIFLWSRLINIPFWTFFNMLFVILYKDLHATPLQITIILALKPAASLFSPYWSTWIYQRQDRLVSNLVWANVLKYLPFLFFPWIANVWLFIFSFGFYMIFVRGVVPAWMEIIKLNVNGKERERLLGFSSLVDYLGSAILPIGLGWVLDSYPGSWRWFFFGTAWIGIISTLFLLFLPVNSIKRNTLPFSLRGTVLKPWKETWALLLRRPDFARFQIGYMLGGGALMMIHSILPTVFVDHLHLSYQEIFFAISICKGIGFALSTPYWVRRYREINIYHLCALVTLVTGFFPLILLFSNVHVWGVYLAYFLYGVMQAGSELSWHMSGPYFAGKEDSSCYSGTNVLAVGLRGCIAPAIGTYLYTATNSYVVLLFACGLCLLATERLRFFGKMESLSQK